MTEQAVSPLSPSEVQILTSYAGKINFLKMDQRRGIILRMLLENATIIKELNALRAAAGQPPYATYDPKG